MFITCNIFFIISIILLMNINVLIKSDIIHPSKNEPKISNTPNSNCAKNTFFVRKCCEIDQYILLEETEDRCTKIIEDVQFSLEDFYPSNTTIDQDKFTIVHGFPDCKKLYPTIFFQLSNDGKLIVNSSSESLEYSKHINTENDIDDYCIDISKQDFWGITARVCLNTITTPIPVGMGISVVFYLITFIVYAVLPELKNLNGHCLMCHIGSFCVGCLGYVITTSVKHIKSNIICCSLGYMTYFSFFAGFLWLNVMCFDVWWVFKKMQPTSSSGGSVRLKENKEKFIAYSIYAWGTALGFLIILILMDCIPEDATSETFSFIKPKFGQNTCWILEYKSIWLYFYGPLLLLFLSNIFFFVITIKKVIGFSRQTKVLKNKNSRRHTEREYKRYMVYMKLFVIMGVPWILEVISSVTIQMYPKTKYNDLWYIVDFFNSLRGLLIFVIFVMKKRILRKLNNKFCPSVKIWSDHNFLSRRCTYSSTSGSVAERRKDSVADSVASLQRLNSVATSTSSVSEIRKNSLIAYHKNSMSDEIDGGKMKPLTIQEEDSPDL
ncbi:G-protein coupled receptor Mth2-like isoform X3 [Lycorma delicatula]|uniref:G-protein coupled receptor Mth2-like isoform X3 n=1 Tax=Lycorma delicatula TaxID=130591 RepID=UPI003F5183AA